MQRLELKHRGKFLGAPQLVADTYAAIFRCERKRKSHKRKDFTEEAVGVSMSRSVCTVNRLPVFVWTCIRTLAYRSRTANKPATTLGLCG